MVGFANPAKMLPAMIRTVFVFVVALLCALWGDAARAQMSDADIVTRMDRLEGAIRDLTGQVEQLQYRNQQLTQQVQQLQQQLQAGASAPPSSPGRRGDAFNPAANPTAPGAPRALGSSTAANEPPPPVSDAPAPGARQPGAPLDLSIVTAPPGGPPPASVPRNGDLPPPPAA